MFGCEDSIEGRWPASMIAMIEGVRTHVAEVRESLPTTLDAYLLDDRRASIVRRSLFTAVQWAVETAEVFVMHLDKGVDRRYENAFEALAQHAVLDSEVANRMVDLARRFRPGPLGAGPREVFEGARNACLDLGVFCAALRRRLP